LNFYKLAINNPKNEIIKTILFTVNFKNKILRNKQPGMVRLLKTIKRHVKKLKKTLGQMRQHTSVILALERLRQEDREF
jgi:hypothetical protein